MLIWQFYGHNVDLMVMQCKNQQVKVKQELCQHLDITMFQNKVYTWFLLTFQMYDAWQRL